MKCSAEDLRRVKDSHRQSEGAPMMFPRGLKSAEQLDDAIEAHKKMIDDLAVKYGLPPAPMTPDGIDHYGMLGTGEFITR